MFLTDSDRKKLSIKSKKKIEETLKKNKKVNTKKLFDIWSPIALETEHEFEMMYYIERAKPWGYNGAKISTYLYNKFIEDNHGDFEKKVFDLLNLAKNKSPQSTGKDKKYPFKQKVFPDEMNDGDWYAPPGEDVEYSKSKKIQNPYDIGYFRKTKIPFFKGPLDQENFIFTRKWQSLYSYGFIFGYILSWQNFIRVNWNIKRKDNDRNFPDVNVKLTKRKINYKFEEILSENLFKKYLRNYLKIDKDNSEKIFSDIQKSIYDSKLTLYLYARKDNYFTFRERNFKRTLEHHYEQVGTSEFLGGILGHKKLYLGNTEEGRFYNTVLNSRIDARKKEFQGSAYNYEQFLMYTMSLEFLSPLDINKLKINEKDIFLRFAINRGKDEFLDYAFGKIF